MDKETQAKLMKEVPTYKLVTVAVLCDRLKINASVARRALLDLEKAGHIKKVSSHRALNIYTRATAVAAAGEEAAAAAVAAPKA